MLKNEQKGHEVWRERRKSEALSWSEGFPLSSCSPVRRSVVLVEDDLVSKLCFLLPVLGFVWFYRKWRLQARWLFLSSQKICEDV